MSHDGLNDGCAEDLHYDTGMLDGLPCQWLYKYA